MDFDEEYEIERIIDIVFTQNYKIVALQLPDSLLGLSTNILSRLEQRCSRRSYKINFHILADTTYGECCVDEIAAQHLKAELIVHFGHACFSRTTRLPVVYILPKELFCEKTCLNYLQIAESSSVDLTIFIEDYYYHHFMHSIWPQLTAEAKAHIHLAEIAVNNQLVSPDADPDTRIFCGRRVPVELLKSGLAHHKFLFIGDHSASKLYTLLSLRFISSEIDIFNPLTNKIYEHSPDFVMAALNKRAALVEKARNTDLFGILVGTLGLTHYKDALLKAKQLIQHAGKRFYTIVVGKLNVAKLANFIEIEMYVFIACPENNLVDCSDFVQPIIGLYELELALNPGRVWDGHFNLDFAAILSGGIENIPLPKQEQEDLDDSSQSSTALMINSPNTVVASFDNQHSASLVLAGRSWQGLDLSTDPPPVKKFELGLSGIPIHYE